MDERPADERQPAGGPPPRQGQEHPPSQEAGGGQPPAPAGQHAQSWPPAAGWPAQPWPPAAGWPPPSQAVGWVPPTTFWPPAPPPGTPAPGTPAPDQTPQAQGQTWTGQQYWPPYVAWPQWQYPSAAAPIAAQPARRGHGLRVAAACVLLVTVWAALVMGLPWLAAVVGDRTAGTPSPRSDAGLTRVPAAIAAADFKPSPQERSYFAAVGFNSRQGTYVVKWDQSVVRVAILGPARAGDRRTLATVLRMVDRTDHVHPRFVMSCDHPDITIRFVAHDRFVASQKWGDKVAGVCFFDYAASGGLSSARIRIDDALTTSSGERPSTLFHEFGHAIGLDDTKAARWRDTIMYYETGGPTSYTRLDLAAIRMLYDSRVSIGEAREPAISTWNGK